MSRDVVIVGAGLTGLTAARTLNRRGHHVTVYEQEFHVGGHTRSETMRGVPYEPHGPHIFHTADEDVWKLVTKVTEMVPYRHRGLTEVRGEMFSWPLQYDELHRLDEWRYVEAELQRIKLGGGIDDQNFETWCVSQIGPTLYGLFIDGYTTKQWGRPGSELAASIGPKRVELRRDGHRELFRDPHQGWPMHGYGALAEGLIDDYQLVLGEPVAVDDLESICAPGTPVVVTAALDDFLSRRYGPLEWRGVHSVARWFPDVEFAQEAMIVNRPSLEVPYTRTVETKWASASAAPGTVVMYEYPGAPAKHYPVPDADGANGRVQQQYLDELKQYERNPLFAAGRLARYTYINMDEAIRDGLDVAKLIDTYQP